MKTFEEIKEIVAQEIAKYPFRNSYPKPYNIDVLTVEGIEKQREDASNNSVFPIFWLETIKVDGNGSKDELITDGFIIKMQYFNNKKDMIPVLEKEEMDTYTKHALMEFTAAGWLDNNGNYCDEMQQSMCEGVVRLLKTFSEEGHSGSSTTYAINLFKRLANLEPLAPLTGEDWEWYKNENGEMSKVYFTSKDSHVDITFPFTKPESEYVFSPTDEYPNEKLDCENDSIMNFTKPIKLSGDKKWICDKCASPLEDEYHYHNYCPHCGKMVIWEKGMRI
jgi:rubrerythrin